jgi:hypothetical protein
MHQYVAGRCWIEHACIIEGGERHDQYPKPSSWDKRVSSLMAGVVPPRMSFVHDDCHQWPLTHFQDGDPITGWIGRLA